MPSPAAPPSLQRMLAFLNTLDIESGDDALDSPAALASWLTANDLADAGGPDLTDADLQLARQVREDLRAALLAEPGSDHVPAPLEQIPLVIAFGRDGTPQLVPVAGGVAGALGRLLRPIPGAVADGSWERTKICGRDTCRWAFFDGSRNRSRRWCSMEVCGNREKSRNFRDRHDGRAGD